MASPNKVTKEIELEGQKATLAVDLNFYHTFQRLTGRDLLSGGDTANLNAREITALVLAAMRSGKSELVKGLADDEAIELVGSLIHPMNLAVIGDAVQGLMLANSPKAEPNAPLAATEPVEEGVPTG